VGVLVHGSAAQLQCFDENVRLPRARGRLGSDVVTRPIGRTRACHFAQKKRNQDVCHLFVCVRALPVAFTKVIRTRSLRVDLSKLSPA
jgi:hypothetical protein